MSSKLSKPVRSPTFLARPSKEIFKNDPSKLVMLAISLTMKELDEQSDEVIAAHGGWPMK